MVSIVEQKRGEIAGLCRRFGVLRLELFGSAATNEFDPERSDIDFLVEFPLDYDFGPWARRFTRFRQALSDLLGRPVDVIMSSALENQWLRREAQKTRIPVYNAPEVSEVA